MVHLANAGPRAKGPIFFNVDHPVGQGPGVPKALSLSADVQLVQVFLKVLGFYKPTNVVFSGVNDTDTINAITQFQLNNTSPKPDGRISVATGEIFAPNSPFAIVTLNRLVRSDASVSNVWPRIHRIPGMPVPPLLFTRVTEMLGVS
jgi:Putative peptidoglycan binding domain